MVMLLLADERVDVNQAEEVRVGGEGEGGWRERAGRVGRVRYRAKCVSWRRAAGAHISREARVRGRELYVSVRGFLGMEAVSREHGGARGRREGGGEGG